MATELARLALQVANSQHGVTEHPAGSNSGPEVDEYLASVGAEPGNAWCAAFASWCIKQAAKDLQTKPEIKYSAGAQALWFKNPQLTIQPDQLQPDDLPCLFVHRHEGGKGHVGFVAGYDPDTQTLQTIEGNSNAQGSRTGGSVVYLTRDANDPKLLGFVRIQ